MKKNIYLILFGLLLGTSFVSCDNTTNDIFDQSAAERKTEAINEYQNILKSSDQGWLFQYFPEENQKYGGYAYVLQFHEHDSVTIWKEGITESETSLYDVISYGGPVLTFNTYNSLMHEFATPSADEYNAKGGDYEFLLNSSESDMINVKGTKTGNLMHMIKMTEDADTYFAKLKDVSDYLIGASMGTKIKDTDITIILGNRHLNFKYNDGKEDVSTSVPFVFTDKGIRLYESTEILGASIQEFTLDKDKKQLIADSGNMAIDIAFAPVNLVLDRWSINTAEAADRSDAVKSAWDQIYAADQNTWGETLYDKVFVGLCYAKYGDIGVSFYSFTASGSAYRSHYNLGFGGVVGHDDYLNIIKLDGGFNWKWYTHFEPFVNVLADNAPYITEMDNADDPTVVKLTSVSNPDIWFVIRK